MPVAGEMASPGKLLAVEFTFRHPPMGYGYAGYSGAESQCPRLVKHHQQAATGRADMTKMLPNR
jgi:hypothetical protein